ncbi:MAG: hypothetical protein QG611_1204 [Bacteroidota bacterium]|nr:hypothetical protein [Bacteroidota bacterium]
MMNNKLGSAGILLFPLILSSGCHSQTVNDQEKPNVIFILTDDQGYGDLACHGNPWIKTPNLDKLHSESIRFTNFHTGTTSAPTRSGIMTGKYCNKVGVWHTINGREFLSSDETTLAESMKQAGYRTAIFGKWHLGDSYPFRPQDRGFDEVLVNGGGGVGQQPDYWNNDYFDDTYFHNGKPEKFSGYCTDVWFTEALKFIKNNKNQPFFCYLATNAPHSPYNVEDKYSDLYKNNPDIPNPNFYGMITNIDENVGILRRELDELGISRNTLLIFMTDNGTSGGVKFGKDGELVSGYNAGMRGIKGSPYDGGHRVPFFIHWPEARITKGRDIQVITSYIDFMPTLLDLCGVKPPQGVSFDGISLKPLIYSKSEKLPDRIIFTDTQRAEHLVKWKQFAVMTDRWRLVGKNELYDMSKDPGQKTNVASENHEQVNKLLADYEIWWKDVAQNADKYNYVKIGTQFENPVRLNCHSAHLKDGTSAWNQEMVRVAPVENGYWPVELVQSGNYEFKLYRWPEESQLRLNDPAPEGGNVPGGKPYPEGKALTIKTARIKIGEQELQKNVNDSEFCSDFTIHLKAGLYELECSFTDTENVVRDAYYVYVKYSEK